MSTAVIESCPYCGHRARIRHVTRGGGGDVETDHEVYECSNSECSLYVDQVRCVRCGEWIKADDAQVPPDEIPHALYPPAEGGLQFVCPEPCHVREP